MTTAEAFAMLEKGTKVRRKVWDHGDYIKLDKYRRIVDKNNRPCPIQLSKLHKDWEIIW